ncbi:MAG: hypothetical protein ABIY51_15490, partial [Ferruginibacter sp.]
MNKLLYLALCLTLLLYGFAVKSQVSLINENFNGTGLPPGWTVINNSSGGIAGPGEAKWTLRPDGYQYGSQYIDPPIIFHSNDFSQFYLSNSDAQGDPPPA